MAGRLSLRRTPQERRDVPLRGYKLAYPMLSADGTEAGFTGVSLGRTHAYRVTAEAKCAQSSRHQSPSRLCDCGFYCFHELADARALACDPQYQQSVLLEVDAAGRYFLYERGVRYSKQTVTAVHAGLCACGWPAQVFVATGTGVVGWRKLLPVCSTCAGNRPPLTLEHFSRLAGVPVHRDDRAVAFTTGSTTSAPELVPLLSAEVALLHARLDELQTQLDKLTKGS
ncbi:MULTISPECIES: hypothetical protein [Amycolatopsis methanolica group]|uniref:Uncharacterized protein n=2 Tax=Amycolatopsis methanolica group TaxID=2893674 RepID=A0A076MND3_AMYME|nr:MULTISPECIES: hypothetical protein [Amycolatopsis methanolica group]AIJ22129.1 hypothetical protein AMETH_2037 [Amycolatopsis methanolica 239]ROS39066.1 hypothetical protein EDD35_1359 [Amycolatopsis thermoflava]